METAIRATTPRSTRNARITSAPLARRPLATVAGWLLRLRTLAGLRGRQAAFAGASDAEAAFLAGWTSGRELDAAKWNALAPVYAATPRWR